jgi:hypothetical protein
MTHDIHAFFAAMLLVGLGLGLIYLSAMDRIAAWAVFAVLLGSGAVVALLVVVREAAEARARRPSRPQPGGSPSRP